MRLRLVSRPSETRFPLPPPPLPAQGSASKASGPAGGPIDALSAGGTRDRDLAALLTRAPKSRTWADFHRRFPGALRQAAATDAEVIVFLWRSLHARNRQVLSPAKMVAACRIWRRGCFPWLDPAPPHAFAASGAEHPDPTGW